MPIQFPRPKRGSPFDRWMWQRGAKPPQQRIQPNLAAPGFPFNADTLNGMAGKRVAVNVRNLGQPYRNVSAAMPNPVGLPVTNRAIPDRVMSDARGQLTGVSRDSAGAALGGCTVWVFKTAERLFLAETVSDGAGNWSMVVGLIGDMFYVEYKAGAPDLAGTSKNNLGADSVI